MDDSNLYILPAASEIMNRVALTTHTAFFLVLSFIVLGLVVGSVIMSTAHTSINGWNNFAGYVTEESVNSSGNGLVTMLVVLVLFLVIIFFFVRRKTHIIQGVTEGYY